ncbi:MAG: hypothetical protein HC837_02155 [Chloroflexaceae bacterium]|nr:hypothetical protein [Chloroflexaceae bacterium]
MMAVDQGISESTGYAYNAVLGQLIVHLRELIPDDRQTEADKAVALAQQQLHQVDADLSAIQADIDQPLRWVPYLTAARLVDWTVIAYCLAVVVLVVLTVTLVAWIPMVHTL